MLDSERLLSFSEFPEEIQLSILSRLSPSDLAIFSSTSKQFESLCNDDNKIWFSMCERRWCSKTNIRKWGNGEIKFKVLYKSLEKLENLIGFWRRVGQTRRDTIPLVFFEWGSYFITGSRVCPSKSGGYEIQKIPFLWIGLSAQGKSVSFMDPDFRFGSLIDFIKAAKLEFFDNDLVSVDVCFMGKSHIVIEEIPNISTFSSPQEKTSFQRNSSLTEVCEERSVFTDNFIGGESTSSLSGSYPDNLTSEIYQYFANRTSDEKAYRRQRKKGKERQTRRKLEAEHYVKIINCSPTPLRPLQGLWKGISDDSNLNFYLVIYDDIGGLACQKIGNALQPYSICYPVFWASSIAFVDFPCSREEELLYASRVHLHHNAVNQNYDDHFMEEDKIVTHILHVNSSEELVYPNVIDVSSYNPNVEGRVWRYGNGTFGFGFLRNNFVIDLKQIALNGNLLDIVEQNCNM